MTVVTGARLTLRPFTDADFDAVHAFATEPEVWRYVEWGPNTVEDTRGFLADTAAAYATNPQQVYRWAVTLTATGDLIGSIELDIVNAVNGRATFGYVLARSHWGHGYATEAASLVIDYGFAVLGLHRIEATCDTRNAASVRVLEKAGLAREGIMRGHRLIRGEWGDSLLYAVTTDNSPPSKFQRIAAYGLARLGESVLLVRVAESPRGGGGLWMLPGGGIEHGENPERAVVREFAEETGFEVVVERLLDVGSDHRTLKDGTDYHGVFALYEVTVVSGTLRDEVSGSTDKVEWVHRSQVGALSMLGTFQNVLQRWLRGAAGE